MNETAFSTRAFADAWCEHVGEGLYPFPLPTDPTNAHSLVYAIAKREPMGLVSVDFGPASFYGSPGWDGELQDGVLDAILRKLRSYRISHFTWSVRFDHQQLAHKLSHRLPALQRGTTQVLSLEQEYEAICSGFNSTIRYEIRKASKAGVRVRSCEGVSELAAYYAIHQRLVSAKRTWGFIMPMGFLLALIQPGGIGKLFVATQDDQIIGGAIFLCDGNSIFYLHSAHDRQYSQVHPTCAILDHAIRWAHQSGATTFNFGGSGGIASLENFKSFWGSRSVDTWTFHWRNPMWQRLGGLLRWLR